jgi:hypothetical protein
MQRRATIKALSAAAALLVAAGGATAAKADSGPSYRSGMVSCSLTFRGHHKLVQRNLGCGAARRNAIFVIKRLKEPAGFTCSLGRVEQGYASCSSGPKAFSVSPG